MIYIFSGGDTKSKNLKIKALSKDREIIILRDSEVSKDILLDYSTTESLFGDLVSVVVNNILKNESFTFSKNELEIMFSSQTIFFFLEDKLPVALSKKYDKFAKIENFEEKIIKKREDNISFDIAQAFEKKDKIKAWILYNQAVEKGVEPEAITGILFWKIKMLAGQKGGLFTKDELKNCGGKLVSIYHKAHLGEIDFILSLEQYLLSVLSK